MYHRVEIQAERFCKVIHCREIIHRMGMGCIGIRAGTQRGKLCQQTAALFLPAEDAVFEIMRSTGRNCHHAIRCLELIVDGSIRNENPREFFRKLLFRYQMENQSAWMSECLNRDTCKRIRSFCFFKGLTANPGINISRTLTPVLAYDMYVIQYSIIWNREESLCSVTATNNWLLSEFRIDGLLEASIYSAQLGEK